jgi:hypothetical protein
MSLNKLSLGVNNDVIYKLFPPWESLVSDIQAGDGNIGKPFLLCKYIIVRISPPPVPPPPPAVADVSQT